MPRMAKMAAMAKNITTSDENVGHRISRHDGENREDHREGRCSEKDVGHHRRTPKDTRGPDATPTQRKLRVASGIMTFQPSAMSWS